MHQVSTLEPPVVLRAGPRAGVLFLIVTVLLYGGFLFFLPFSSPKGLYNSPDEMANALFAERVAEEGHLVYPAREQSIPSSVTPRSMLRMGDLFVPVGLVSVPVLFGILMNAGGIVSFSIIFALVSMWGLVCWYGFLRAVFGVRLALLATLLTATHPFVLYWAERPFLPNSWFLSFIFFALYFLVRALRLASPTLPRGEEIAFDAPLMYTQSIRKYIFAALGGLTLGVAVSLRPQEGFWLILIPVYLTVVPRLRKRISLFPFILFAAIPLGALFLLQNRMYGSPVHTGYHLTPLAASGLNVVKNIVAPFGINFEQIGTVITQYGLKFVWWFALLFCIGVVLAYMRTDGRLLRRLRFWIGAFVIVFAWLLLFYGSFLVQDRFDGNHSIGTSFTRYFLPLYVMSTPVVAYALFRIHARAGRVVSGALVVVGVVVSLRLIVWSTDESLVHIPKVLAQNREIQTRALEILPKDAVVLTDRSDKIFFPHREVVTRFRKFHQPDFEELYGLNLYYETIADRQVVDFENEFYWGPHRLRAVEPVDLGYRHTLYRLELLEKDDTIHSPNS